MNSFQRLIKYFALALAVFLIITIVSGIVGVGYGILKFSGLVPSNSINSNFDHSKYETYLDINVKYASLKIVTGNSLKVENTNKKINTKIDGNKIIITDSSSVFTKNNDKELVVYIPDIKFDIACINTGSGKVSIDGLKTNNLQLNLGAGSTKIKNVASDNTKINAGTGSVNINNSILNDAILELGIGSININSNITGNSKIECGIGSVNIDLPQSKNNYSFDIEKGIGQINLNGNKVEKDGKYNSDNGLNYLEIEGGIGSININTQEK